jgi:hypothetical protein
VRLSLSLALLLLGGCAETQPKLLPQAAFDLKCPEADLEVVELSRNVLGVKGCSRQATYVWSCNGPEGALGTNCDWAMNARD